MVGRRALREGAWYVRVWRSPLFIVVGLALVGIIAFSVVREGLRRLELQHEIDKLNAEVIRLESRNGDLKSVIALLNTANEQAKQARTKLGVQSPGEQVIIFSDVEDSPGVVLPDSDTKEYIPIRDYQPNPQKWFRYFWNNYTQP
ncbi:MAG: septum formation initiator family protein [Candidatus Kerfeldbacteria bacterium]|nr:septum formation initiator family protein [Candidatus Kerfeldbacteria bacterium]